MQPIHTIALNLIKQIKRIAVTEDESLVKNEQRLRLFSSRRQPPLLVAYPITMAEYSFCKINYGCKEGCWDGNSLSGRRLLHLQSHTCPERKCVSTLPLKCLTVPFSRSSATRSVKIQPIRLSPNLLVISVIISS